jgi:hypothetical protein
MRLLLAMADPTGAIQTALLQDGHHVRRHAPVSRLTAWRASRTAASFGADAVLTDSDAGEELARRLGVPTLRPELAAEFLPDPFPPRPFGPARRDPPELALVLPDPPPPALLPDIVLLNAATLGQAPHWMAAARPIAAPEGARPYLVHEETALLHAPGNPAPALACLIADPALCAHLAAAARRRFEQLHHEAHTALRRLVVQGI